jgi:hypothetical protein
MQIYGFGDGAETTISRRFFLQGTGFFFFAVCWF